MKENNKVLLGMSGGTDSSVAALLLQDAGYEVTGITFRFYEKDGNGENEIVVVDYKTDFVKDGGELLKKYKKQLDYYQLTLERLTGKRVKEKIIYSFCLKEEIHVE